MNVHVITDDTHGAQGQIIIADQGVPLGWTAARIESAEWRAGGRQLVITLSRPLARGMGGDHPTVSNSDDSLSIHTIARMLRAVDPTWRDRRRHLARDVSAVIMETE